MVERPAVKVERSRAEELRRRLKSVGAIDEDFKPKSLDGHVFFPLRSIGGIEGLLREYSAELTSTSFMERRRRPRGLREILEKLIPPELHPYIPSSMDLVGRIALIDIPEELENYREEIGRAVMQLYPHVETVLSKEGETLGEYRIRSFRIVAGSPVTETVHREHGCVYRLDLSKTFFNPRMGGERLRVASAVREGEDVLDMFAGVGPFSILIAKMRPTARVLAVEINPDAYKYLLENISLNKVSDRVKALMGDVRDVLRGTEEVFDRVIMDLPFRSLEFLGLALKVSKPGGVIHVYHVERGDAAVEAARRVVAEEAGRMGYHVEVTYSREVMEVAPRRYIVSIDLSRVG